MSAAQQGIIDFEKNKVVFADVNEELISYIRRIEKLAEEKAAISEDQKEIFKEAKGRGFDPKIIRRILAERKKGDGEVQTELELVNTYRRAAGMSPLFS